MDQTQRLNGSDAITSRAFYDGYGDLVEARDPAPAGQDVVRYQLYDAQRRVLFASVAYFVPAYTGAAGPSAFSTPDVSQLGTNHNYANARSSSVTDPLGHTTTTGIGVECGWQAPGDPSCYVYTVSTDANQHETLTLTDAWVHTHLTQSDTGTGTSSDPYVGCAIAQYGYDALGDLTTIMQPDGSHTASLRYDSQGRLVGMTDPDRGTESYTYDADGNRIQSTDARGINIYAGYDGLDRQLWRNTSNSSSGAYVTYSYDGGPNGIGHLTGETFSGGPNNTLSGSYGYSYDVRGQQIGQTLTVNGTGGGTFTTQTAYDDASNVTSQTYPDGEVVSSQYTAQGWLAGLTTQQGGSPATALISNVGYSGVGGASHLLTSATLGGNVYRYAASYDALLRLTNLSLTRLSDSTTQFEETRQFDAVGNLTSLATTLPNGTDTQAFCYDDLNRLTWASSASGAIPCGGTNTAGTLTSAQYQQSFGYDTLGRLASGPLGSYTYGDSAHLHAATSIGSSSNQWTASYDAAGDMTCRRHPAAQPVPAAPRPPAPSSATTPSSGSPPGRTRPPHLRPPTPSSPTARVTASSSR